MTETLKGKLKSCRLVGIEEQYRRIVSEAKDEDWSYERFFETLLDESIAVRENNRFQRLTKQAKFPTLKTMEQFDFMKAP